MFDHDIKNLKEGYVSHTMCSKKSLTSFMDLGRVSTFINENYPREECTME